MTTLASSLVTRTRPPSTWWCGSRLNRPTGRQPPSELWPSPAYSWRWEDESSHFSFTHSTCFTHSCFPSASTIALLVSVRVRLWSLDQAPASIWETHCGTQETPPTKYACCGRTREMWAGRIRCPIAGTCSTAHRLDTSGIIKFLRLPKFSCQEQDETVRIVCKCKLYLQPLESQAGCFLVLIVVI